MKEKTKQQEKIDGLIKKYSRRFDNVSLLVYPDDYTQACNELADFIRQECAEVAANELERQVNICVMSGSRMRKKVLNAIK